MNSLDEDVNAFHHGAAKRAARWLRRRGWSFDDSTTEHEPDTQAQIAQASLRLGALGTVDQQGRVTPLARRRAARRDSPTGPSSRRFRAGRSRRRRRAASKAARRAR